MVLLEIIGVVIVLILIIVVVLYNGFVQKRNRVQDAWAQIDVQLKRRYDLIPNLMETVKGYARYEKSVFTQVTQLRSAIVTGSVQDKADANNMLSGALKSIFAVAENYPDLKASANFQNLQQQLADTEDKIAFVRISYNDYVLDYNNALQEFPGNLLAGLLNFTKAAFFQAPAESREPIKVDFSDMGNAQQTQPEPPKAPSKKGPKKPKASS